MKVYIRNEERQFDYPDDMKRILDYLNEHGTILVNERTIEELYRDFSDDAYCAGWMSVDERRLEEFANWLEDRDI